MAARVAAFLEDSIRPVTSPVTFLAACCYKLKGEVAAWKQHCRMAVDPAAAAGGTQVEMGFAVSIWQTAQAILASGHLEYTEPQAGPADTAAAHRKAAKEAARECRKAMQLLGFEHEGKCSTAMVAAWGPENGRQRCPASASEMFKVSSILLFCRGSCYECPACTKAPKGVMTQHCIGDQ